MEWSQSCKHATGSSSQTGMASRSGSHSDLSRLAHPEAACSAASTSCPCCQKPTRPSKGAGRPQRARRRLSLPGVCKAVLLLAGLLLGLHALSCGLLFCVRLPWTMSVPSEAYQELHGLYGLSGGPRRIDRGVLGADDAPKLIPRVIHQTFKSGNHIPPGVQPLMQSWRSMNTDWDIRFYDDKGCLDFVRQEFPEYYAAYKALPKNVERSDFFRYMVVLRLGGVYADIDTECKQPLNDLILPRDTLIVGTENEFGSIEHAKFRSYARERQLLQWVFAAAPGHPALREICDFIAKHATSTFLVEANLDTLERTGPGIWTDVVLKHALQNPPSKETSPFTVRVLPKAAFGAHPTGLDGVSPEDPAVLVLHHYKGTWKLRGLDMLTPGTLASLATRLYHFAMLKLGKISTVRPQRLIPRLYPVSISTHPPFTMLVDLVGHGDVHAGDDVSSVLTKFGLWQPSLAPQRGPSVLDAVLGGLGKQGSGRIMVDVGAGQGLFSLAAAARGHRALAFELSRKSVASFNASIHFNGFQQHIALREVALGAHQETICVDLVGEGLRPPHLGQGYAHPSDHSGHGPACQAHGSRLKGSTLLPPEVAVGSLRISAPGWEGWILDGFRETLENAITRPHVIMIELYPARMDKLGYAGGALGMLEQLHALGYTDVSHAGHACDSRWEQLVRRVQAQPRGLAGAPADIKQPTWCTLPRTLFPQVLRMADSKRPENILLTYQGPKAILPPSASAENVTSSEDLGSEDLVQGQGGNAGEPAVDAGTGLPQQLEGQAAQARPYREGQPEHESAQRALQARRASAAGRRASLAGVRKLRSL